MPFFLSFFLTIILLLSSLWAEETYIGKKGDIIGISRLSFVDFKGIEDHITLNGVALIKVDEFSQEEAPSTMLRLTPRVSNPKGYIAGSMYLKYPFRGFADKYAFSSFYRFRITGANLYDGSGMFFVIHSDQRKDKALGKCAYCMGFGGNALIGKSVKPSIGIEFDVHAGASDHDYNMVGLNFHGSLKSKFIHTGSFLPNGRSAYYESPYTDKPINNGKVWNVWVDFDGSLIEVRSSQETNRDSATLHLRREINMRDAMSLRRSKEETAEPIVYVGFSADPGKYPAYTDLLEWHFRPCYKPYGNFNGNKINIKRTERIDTQTVRCFESDQ